MSLLPQSPDEPALPDAEPRVVDLSSDDAADLLSVFASATARRILLTIQEEVMSASALADELDSSVQNVHYHLDRLLDADAIEVVATAYSPKGREMDLYGPAAKPLVVCVGGDDEQADLAQLCSQESLQG